jgi:hypothetical protein
LEQPEKLPASPLFFDGVNGPLIRHLAPASLAP